MPALVSVLLALLLLVLPPSALADWCCDGDRLSLETISGGVDVRGLTGGIPNTSNGTLPGDGILLHWRGMTLQLPRTNNSGIPSYTDGRWWWRAADPDHPEFKQRRGEIVRYVCERIE